MDSNQIIRPAKSSSRRKFVWGFGAFSVMAAVAGALKFPFSLKKTLGEAPAVNPGKTVTMLTQDGTLVTIDRALLSSGGKKASNKELQNWIKK